MKAIYKLYPDPHLKAAIEKIESVSSTDFKAIAELSPKDILN